MSWARRILNTLRPGALANELDREFVFHLKERIEELQASGMSEAEAKATAQRQFGNLTLQKERTRDMNLSAVLDGAMRNLRLSGRSLARAPLLSAAVILTLALGIGANSAVFSVIDAVLLRPLSFPNGDELMSLRQHNTKSPETVVAPIRLDDWNRMNSTFQNIAGYYTEDVSELSGPLPERLKRASVTARFLQVWGVAPAVGRDFAPEEQHFGGPNAVLISDRFWRRRFAADPKTVGQKLRFPGVSPTIVGIMSASFLFPDRDVDVWWAVPAAADMPLTRSRKLTWFTAVGRLNPGVSIDQARSDLALVQSQLGRQFPDPDADITTEIVPLKEETIGGVRRSLWIVFGSVSLLLLIACANITALLLARAIQRRQEVSVRFALGASRFSVAVQLLTETGLLALAGTALGLMLAAWAPALFRVMAGALPRMNEVKLDWRIVGYSLVCSVAVTMMCGLIPALRSVRSDASLALTQSGRSQVSGRYRVQWLLVGVQVALAVTLLSGAGLLVRSFEQLGRVSPGFEVAHILTFHISATYAETNDYPSLNRRIDGTLQFVRAIPGVQASATTSDLPGLPGPPVATEFKLMEGGLSADVKITPDVRFVSPGYFETMKIPFLSGESCPHGAQSNAARFGGSTVVVNRSFIDRYFGGASGLGRHLTSNLNLPAGEIRGVVGDTRERGLELEPVPMIYWCSLAPNPSPIFLIRTAGDPSAMITTIRHKIHEIEPNRSVFNLIPLEDRLGDAHAEDRLRTLLLVVFAFTAVSLASIGLYSTLSYLVTVRRREVGLRLALGAERNQIVQQFLKQGFRVTLAACAAGLGLSFLFTRLLAGMLYGVSPHDPATLSFVLAMVIAVALCASLVPAIHASRVEPMQVLRDE